MLPAPPLLRALLPDKPPPGSPAPLPLPDPPLPGPGRPRAWWRAPASRSALAWFVAAAARAHDGVLLAVARDNHAATQIEADPPALLGADPPLPGPGLPRLGDPALRPFQPAPRDRLAAPGHPAPPADDEARRAGGAGADAYAAPAAAVLRHRQQLRPARGPAPGPRRREAPPARRRLPQRAAGLRSRRLRRAPR